MQAGANKRLIYVYYGNKEQLFETVVGQALGELVDAVPFTPDDLPGYAAGLFDYLIAHPQLMRLGTWKLLERPRSWTPRSTPTGPSSKRSRTPSAPATSAARSTLSTC